MSGPPLLPGQTCRIGGSRSTYEELASQPLRQFSTFLLIAGALAVMAVVVGLLRRPKKYRLFGPYAWPGYTPTSSLVLRVVAAGAVIVIGLLIINRPATCGGEQIRPGDRCVNLQNGGSSSYEDVASAPITQFWFYLVIAAAFVISAIVKLIRRRPPTAEEVADFESQVAAGRERLVNLADNSRVREQLLNLSDADLRAMLARFDQEVEQERRRAGISTSGYFPRLTG